jgi:hypothetical protein
MIHELTVLALGIDKCPKPTFFLGLKESLPSSCNGHNVKIRTIKYYIATFAPPHYCGASAVRVIVASAYYTAAER